MDRFNICQAHQQLESDYNVSGWLRERPSNQRRRESTGTQLLRMGFRNPYGWVDIEAEPSNSDEEEVQMIYMQAVLRLDLPIDRPLMKAIRRTFMKEFLNTYPQTSLPDYKQGR